MRFFVETIACVVLSMLLAGAAVAQVSGYASATYGYNKNPLYNYEQTPDQLLQNFVELAYTQETGPSALRLAYTGGLVMFKRYSDRTYYEQTLGATYAVRYERPKANQEGDDEEEAGTDSTGSYLALGLKGSARHDRALYQDFDNVAAEASGSYRFMLGEDPYMRILGTAGYRSYTNLQELSNVSGSVGAALGLPVSDQSEFELVASASYKAYTAAIYDTLRFQSNAGGNGVGNGNGTGTGGGNGNGKGLGRGNSGTSTGSGSTTTTSTTAASGKGGKQLLTNPQSNGTSQLGLSLLYHVNWGATSLQAGAHLRTAPSGAPRYLAQVSTSSTLSEDIYNDHFTSSAAEWTLTLTQHLPLDVNATLHSEGGVRTFDGPALDLSGNQIADHRQDRHITADLTLTHSFNLGAGFGLDLSLLGGYVRCQSNDDYNDFSGANVGVAVGIGF